MRTTDGTRNIPQPHKISTRDDGLSSEAVWRCRYAIELVRGLDINAACRCAYHGNNLRQDVEPLVGVVLELLEEVT